MSARGARRAPRDALARSTAFASSRTRRPTRTACEAAVRDAARRPARWRCFSDRTSATSIRPAPTRSCAASARVARARRRAAARRRSGEAGARTAARLRRSARRDRGVQQQPARPDQPRARAAISTSTRSATARCGTPPSRASRCISSAARRRPVNVPGASDSTFTWKRARRSGPRARNKDEPGEIVAMLADSGFSLVEQWVDDDDRFALTLVEAA